VFEALDKFVPDWLSNGTIEKPYPLTTLAAQFKVKLEEHVQRQARLERARQSNPYTRNNRGRGRARSNFNG
jgi:hypothetical protein